MDENIVKYLLVIKRENDYGKYSSEIIPCENLNRVMEIVRNEQRICTLYERAGSVAKYWLYMCDISFNILGE